MTSGIEMVLPRKALCASVSGHDWRT